MAFEPKQRRGRNHSFLYDLIDRIIIPNFYQSGINKRNGLFPWAEQTERTSPIEMQSHADLNRIKRAKERRLDRKRGAVRGVNALHPKLLER